MQEIQVQSLDREDPLEKGPTPVFLPGEFHGQRSQTGYSPRGHKELNRFISARTSSLQPSAITSLLRCLIGIANFTNPKPSPPPTRVPSNLLILESRSSGSWQPHFSNAQAQTLLSSSTLLLLSHPMSILSVNPVGSTFGDVQPFLTIFTATTLGHGASASLLGYGIGLPAGLLASALAPHPTPVCSPKQPELLIGKSGVR